ncbi:hypothetical protein [Sporosarcina sp. P17b]|uniref:hypothetical protein n=1 Tax=Sporosarcina sp. P17b TaxID=2048260 RepID=UPI000C65FDA3|nr:hypothetical protein [Sporosarcina sp. P17b]PIC73343.1 hypothetical protein CSV76_11035 [Sporosarcina sp. P17b]
MLRDLLVEIGIDVDSGPLKKLNAEIDALERKLRKLDAGPVESLDRKFNDVNESAKKANRSIGDMNQKVGRLGRSIEQVDSEHIANGFEQSHKEVQQLNRTMKNTANITEQYKDNIEGSRKEAKKLDENLRDADRTSWSMSNSMRKMEKSSKSINRETQKHSKKTVETSTTINKETHEYTQEIKRSMKDINKQMKKSSKTMEDTFSSIDDNIRRTSRELKDSFSGIGEEIRQASKTMEASARRSEKFFDKVSDKMSTISSSMEESSNSSGNTNDEMAKLTKSMEDLNAQLKEISKHLEEAKASAGGMSKSIGGVDLSGAAKDSGSMAGSFEGGERSTRNIVKDMQELDKIQRRMLKGQDKNGTREGKSLIGGGIDHLVNGFRWIESSAINGATFIGKMLAPWGSLKLLAPTLIPVMAGLANVAGNLGPMIGALSGGLLGAVGLFGGAGVAGLAGFLPFLENINLLNGLDPKKDKLTKPQLAAKDSESKLVDNYRAIMKKTEDSTMRAYAMAMDATSKVLTMLEPLFLKVTSMSEGLMKSLHNSLDSELGQEVIKYLNDEAANLLGSLTRTGGNLLIGFLSLVKSLDPLSQWVATGLEDMTASFALWADGVGESDGFKKFVDYTKENLPKLGEIFGNLNVGLVEFFAAFGPSSSDMMTYLVDMTDRFREWASELSDNENFKAFISYVKENTPKMLELIDDLATAFVDLSPLLAGIGEVALDAANGLMDFANEHPNLMKFVAGFSIGLIALSIILTTIAAPLASVAAGILGVFGNIYAGYHIIKGIFNRFGNGGSRSLAGEVMDSMGGKGRKQTVHTFGGAGKATVTSDSFPVGQDGSARALMAAAQKLDSAGNKMISALSNIQCNCNGGGGVVGGKNGQKGKKGPSKKNPVDSQNQKTKSVLTSSKEVTKPKEVATPKGLLGKMGKLGGGNKALKGLGILGLIGSGVSIGGSVLAKDYDTAGRTATATAGGVGGAWAGAATGAALGSVIPGIGTAIGGVVGGIAGSIGGSALGSKLYDGIKGYNWGGLKKDAKDTSGSVGQSWNGVSEAFQEGTSKSIDSMDHLSMATGTSLFGINNTATNALTGLPRVASTQFGGMNTAAGSSLGLMNGTVSGSLSGLDALTAASLGMLPGTASTQFDGMNTAAGNSLGLMNGTVSGSLSGLDAITAASLGMLPGTASTSFGGMTTAAGISLGMMNGTVSGSLSGLDAITTASLGGLATTATTSLGGMNMAVAGEFAQVGNSIVAGLQQTVLMAQVIWFAFVNWMSTSMVAIGTVSSAGFVAMGQNIWQTMQGIALGATTIWTSFIASMGQLTSALASTTNAGFIKVRVVVISQMAAAKTGALVQGLQMSQALRAIFAHIQSSASSSFAGVRTAIVSQMNGARNSVYAIAGDIERRIIKMNNNVASSNAKATASGPAVPMGKLKGINGSHATGLGRVPFNGYTAELHKNEAVLTANQANALRNSGFLRGDGASPQMNMPEATANVAGYSPLGVDPGSTATRSTTNNSGSVKASVTIHVDGSKDPQSAAVSIKDELEGWFSTLSTVFPATMEG